MERDGIDSQNPEGIGKRAWWFLQIVASTPLSVMDPAWLGLPVEGARPRSFSPPGRRPPSREGGAAGRGSC